MANTMLKHSEFIGRGYEILETEAGRTRVFELYFGTREQANEYAEILQRMSPHISLYTVGDKSYAIYAPALVEKV